jgi:formylmethanofuran dehydrogenase subunit E
VLALPLAQCAVDGASSPRVGSLSKIGLYDQEVSLGGRMSHCESRADIEKRQLEEILEYDDYFECKKCNSEQSQSEDSMPDQECRDCHTDHLEKNMFYKLKGWLCEPCANVYELALLKVGQ